MNKFKFLLNLTTLAALIYGVGQVQSYLDDNFIKNDTQIKKKLNNFLNGKVEK